MRISELAQTVGAPVATVKFYLREGLVPAGRATAATQAQYDERHVARFRLARALVQVGGLSVAAARRVMEVLDARDASLHQVLGAAHSALPPLLEAASPPARAMELVAKRGWQVHEGAPALRQLELALQALDEVGASASAERLDHYADAAEAIAAVDIADTPLDDLEEAAATVVIGTVLWEPVLLALRRLAQEARSAELLADAPSGG